MAENPQDIYYIPREDQTSPLTFKDMVEMVWTHKWWYVFSILVCLVFAAVYLYRTPSTYQRTAKVIINEDGQDAALRDLASFTGGMAGKSSGENVNNEVEAFASPDLMQTVVERLGLQTTYTEKQAFRRVEHYTDTPVELKVVEGIPQSSFSFSLEKHKDSILVLSDFKVGSDEIKADRVVGRPSDTLVTPVGRLILTPTVNFPGWDKPYTITWVNSMSKAKSYCTRLSATISGKQTSVIVLSLEDVFPARAENILSTLIDVYNETWIHDKNRVFAESGKGTFGVVMGYTLATICIAVPVENWVLFKQGIHKPLTRQALTLIVTTLFAFAMGAVAYFVGTFIPAGTGWSGVGWFVLRFVFVVVFAAGVFILATCRTEEFKYYKNLAMTIIKKIVGKIKVKLGKKQPAEVFTAIDANEQNAEKNASDENGSKEGVEQEKEDAENCDSEKSENVQSVDNDKQNDGGGDDE